VGRTNGLGERIRRAGEPSRSGRVGVRGDSGLRDEVYDALFSMSSACGVDRGSAREVRRLPDSEVGELGALGDRRYWPRMLMLSQVVRDMWPSVLQDNNHV
jgi:hypothetical protein